MQKLEGCILQSAVDCMPLKSLTSNVGLMTRTVVDRFSGVIVPTATHWPRFGDIMAGVKLEFEGQKY